MPYKDFGAEVLTASDVNTYLMRQAAIRVANQAELDAIPTPVAGMVAYRADNSTFYFHTGTAWRSWHTDTGWVSLPPSANFVLYSGAAYIRYRKSGNVVDLTGYVSPSSSSVATSLMGSSSILLTTLPAGARPNQSSYSICQGSGFDRWLLTVSSDGNAYASRYDGSASTSTWMPFSSTFIAGT